MVSCGEKFTLILTANSQVWAWGHNDEGELGLGDHEPRDTPCQIKRFVLARKKRRMSKSARARPRSAKAKGAVASKGKSKGTAAAATSKSLTGSSKSDASDASAASGRPRSGSDTVAPPHVTHITTGLFHSLCVTPKGVYAWGESDSGCLGLGEQVAMDGVSRPTEIGALRDEHVVSVSAGTRHSGAVTDRGDVFLWGSNEYGQLGIGVSEDDDRVWEPVKLKSSVFDRKVVQLSCGDSHTLARVEHEGEVYSWGLGEDGRLGNGEVEDCPRPRPVPGLRDVTAIEAGRWSTLPETFAIAAAAHSKSELGY